MVSRLGLDPELAIVSRKTGKARSAHLFLGDEKKKYKFTAGSSSVIGSEVERDGPAVEIRSLVASACRDNIVPYMAEAMRGTSLALEKWNDNRFRLSSAPMYELDKTSLKAAPPDVCEFGCNPDIDAYTLQPKSPTLTLGDMRRYTGGHIHASSFSRLRNNVEEQAALAILYDYTVALPMIAILGERHRAGEAERRQFYGQPGSFRWDHEKSKIEFRTLSGRVMLHPTILYWAMGMVRTLSNSVGYENEFKDFLRSNFVDVVSPNMVYSAIVNHDVDAAIELTPRIMRAFPSYEERENDLRNPVNGGGGGVYTPFFYLKSWEVFVEGNAEGIGWDDDLVYNWGLYSDYKPTHHKYWGIQVAMNRQCDDDIFPYNAVLPKVMGEDVLSKTTVYTHPLNGGAAEWTTSGAPHWLQ